MKHFLVFLFSALAIYGIWNFVPKEQRGRAVQFMLSHLFYIAVIIITIVSILFASYHLPSIHFL